MNASGSGGPATAALADALAGSTFLGSLAPAHRDRLLTRAQRRRIRRGEVLFRRGDAGLSLFAVLSGLIKIAADSVDGREIVLNIMGPGDVFGETAVLDGQPRTADAIALEDSELLAIQRVDMLALLDRDAAFARRLIEILCERVRWVSDQYEDAQFLDLGHRLAKKLVYLASAFGRPDGARIRIDLKLSQGELGRMVGVSRESVNKQLRIWQDSGIVDVDGGTIRIDRAALEAEGKAP